MVFLFDWGEGCKILWIKCMTKIHTTKAIDEVMLLKWLSPGFVSKQLIYNLGS